MIDSKKLQIRVRRQQGFTLTELAIVMGIIGLVLGAIWIAAAAVYENQKTDRAVAEIYTVLSSVRQLYGFRLDTGAHSLTAKLVSANAFPSDLVVGGVPQNPWGTTQALAEIPGAGISAGTLGWGGGCTAKAAPNVLQITLWGIPQAAGIKLLSQFIGPAAGAGVQCVYCDTAGAFLTPTTTTTSQLATCSGNITVYIKL